MSKKEKPTKERTDSVYATVNVESDGQISVRYDFETDRIEIFGAVPGSAKTERRFERPSGKPKVVTSIPSDGRSAFDAKRALYAYDWAFAVDTNSIDLHGSRCAACFSHYVQLPPRGYTGSLLWRPLGAFLIRGIAPGINPERIGWFLTLSSLAPHLRHLGRIALVVDSELGLHPAINMRHIGYYESFLLPENVTMVYASADTDKDTLQGVLIHASDRSSRRVLEEFQKGEALPPMTPWNVDRNCDAVASVKFLRES
jgi:hypothetical protein